VNVWGALTDYGYTWWRRYPSKAPFNKPSRGIVACHLASSTHLGELDHAKKSEVQQGRRLTGGHQALRETEIVSIGVAQRSMLQRKADHLQT
jgi:hypothetical protein